MEKFEELFRVSEEISDIIKSLNKEVDNVEKLYMKNYLINSLKNENEELEKSVDRHIKKLRNLEIANGKKQVIVELKPYNETISSSEETFNKDTNQTPNSTNDILKEVNVAKPQKKESEKNVKQNLVDKKGCSRKPVTEEILPIDVGRLDLKIGHIIEIQKHNDADSLYVEKVDIGGPQPITVVSGLVRHVPIEEMKNRFIVVLCNLKPVKMRGILSEGMVMCVSTPDKVEVLSPPSTSKPGDLITVPGYPPPPNGPEPVLNPKKKIFETVAPELLTDSECFATYRGIRWEVSSGGYVQSATLSGVNIK